MILGIDVGQKGGIALIDRHKKVILKREMPILNKELDTKTFKTIINNNTIDAIFIEKVHAMPGQGVTSMFNFGKHYGEILGTIKTLDIPYQLVRPTEWQAYAHRDLDKKLGPKERSLIAVEKFYPELDLRKNTRCRVAHDGIVDAILIALYGLSEYVF